MIDTHSHLLPGLDDGSPDLNSSLRMAEAAAGGGITTVVCTPHLREFDLSFIGLARQTLENFRAALETRGIQLRLLGGFEIDAAVAATASESELRRIAVEDSRGLLLLEMPHWGWPIRFEETLFRLSTLGFLPLLAHPERNDRIQRNPELLCRCIDAGAVAQATAASLDGGFGRAGRSALFRHLEAGCTGVLATDAHFHRDTSWTLAPALRDLRGRLTEQEIDSLTRVNPQRLMKGVRPPAVSPFRRLR